MGTMDRKTLTARLKDVVLIFKERETVGRMKTEHSVFIPAELMRDKATETEEFIIVARHISMKKEWNCPVSVDEVRVVKVSGVEFVFGFNENTDFDAIIDYISSRI